VGNFLISWETISIWGTILYGVNVCTCMTACCIFYFLSIIDTFHQSFMLVASASLRMKWCLVPGSGWGWWWWQIPLSMSNVFNVYFFRSWSLEFCRSCVLIYCGIIWNCQLFTVFLVSILCSMARSQTALNLWEMHLCSTCYVCF